MTKMMNDFFLESIEPEIEELDEVDEEMEDTSPDTLELNFDPDFDEEALMALTESENKI